MKLHFPDDFIWGTSTAAAQIETASDHNWKNFKSKDGHTFNRTTDHEKQRTEDIKWIKAFGSMYRCGVDWARLQHAPNQKFDILVVKEYRDFFELLLKEDIEILFVIHHFTNPMWFENFGGWLHPKCISTFMNYAEQCIEHFGDLVANWNTFNEPNVYCLNAYITGDFPPQKKNYFSGNKAIGNMAICHNKTYDLLKQNDPNKPVGVSLNTALFEGLNPVGKLVAKFTDWWFINRSAALFKKVDYLGLSYYAHILFKPTALTAIDHKEELERLGYPHDDMWAYNPEGFAKIIMRLYDKYNLPILITENGVCTKDSTKRIESIKDYLKIIHRLIDKGIPFLGYIHWSTFDNFEWNLGPTYRFGLASVDLETKERSMTKAGQFYSNICKENAIDI